MAVLAATDEEHVSRPALELEVQVFVLTALLYTLPNQRTSIPFLTLYYNGD